MPNGTELVERLVDIQRAAGESDERFAARLGMSRVAWTRIRNGRRHGSRQFLMAVWAAFPGLVAELSGEASA